MTRRRAIATGVGVLVALLLVLWIRSCISCDRDFELALGIKNLPPTLKHQAIKVDDWQDYSVRAYFEASVSDMDAILLARPYTVTPVTAENVAWVRANPMQHWLPTVPEFATASYHCWTNGRAETQIWLSEKRTQAFVLYGVNFTGK